MLIAWNYSILMMNKNMQLFFHLVFLFCCGGWFGARALESTLLIEKFQYILRKTKTFAK